MNKRKYLKKYENKKNFSNWSSWFYWIFSYKITFKEWFLYIKST